MILIVDDEKFALSLVQRKLAPHQFNILTATTVQEAKNILASNPEIQLIITDLHMPTENGFDLLEWLYQHAPHIKIIVTTAHSADTKVIESSSILKADRILIKPISVEDELLPAIMALL